MEPLESHTHSFIVRIWRERLRSTGSQFTWRGHITHVPGGEREYLTNVDDIGSFITPFLETLDVRLSWRWRVKQWLKKRKRHSIGRT